MKAANLSRVQRSLALSKEARRKIEQIKFESLSMRESELRSLVYDKFQELEWALTDLYNIGK